MYPIRKRPLVGITCMFVFALLIAACTSSTQTEVVRETVEVQVVVTATPDPEAPPPAETTDAAASSIFKPHPILGDVRVRQAIAHCIDRQELIKAIYPFLEEEQRQTMLMDTFIPQGHWAYTDEGITKYPFDPEQGKQLLEEAGWQIVEEGYPRENEAGEALALKFTTTDAAYRVTYATVMEGQLLNNCGIQIVRTHAPASWWFGSSTGLQRRDFELGTFSWVGQADPAGDTIYACNQIPSPENNWQGQNTMGWCNETASQAIIAANNTLDRQERKEYYAIVQQEFSKDMVSLPLFNKFEAAATSNNLSNFEADVSEASYLTNVHEWELTDGGDTVILGFSQEPATLLAAIEDSSVTHIINDLLTTRAATGKGYDYQPVALTELPTIESGAATLDVVEVGEGDMVWTTSGEAVALEPGVEVRNANGEAVEYDGGTIEMEQLTVNFELVEGLTWQDGEPVKQADLELAQKINCDPDLGLINTFVCESAQETTFTSDTTFTRIYVPGAKLPEYFVQTPGIFTGTAFTVGAYPSHITLSDGRSLADVPAKEWSTLPEIAEAPMSYGPYQLTEWRKGQRMVFESNPHYYLGEPKIKTVIIQFFGDTNAAVSQLLTGDVDVLGTEILGAGQELQTVLEAGERGDIQVFPLASATWETMDMNLYTR